MAERDAREPVDADGEVLVHFAPSGQVEVAPARRARTDEVGVVAEVEHGLHARDLVVEARVHAHVENHVDFLVEDVRRQPECRNLAAHHAAAGGVAIEHVDLVAEGQEIPCHRERRRTGAEQGDALAVPDRRNGRQIGADVALVIRCHALQPTDRDRLLLRAHAAAGRLAGTVAGASEDARKYVGLPVDHVRLGVAFLDDQPDVLGYGRVGGTCPLAIHDLVEIGRVPDIGGFHDERGFARAQPMEGVEIFTGVATLTFCGSRIHRNRMVRTRAGPP